MSRNAQLLALHSEQLCAITILSLLKSTFPLFFAGLKNRR